MNEVTLDLKRNKMKQTSVEWLFEKLWETPKDKLTWHSILEQAKQMENKQTAVQWLFTMLNNPNSDQVFAKKLLDKAKEMEKEQIIDAYDKGEFNQGCNEDAEQYYKENYKSE